MLCIFEYVFDQRTRENQKDHPKKRN